MHIYSSTINGTLNRTTILLVLLIVMSLFLPATAIKYASGSPENSTAPPSGFTENNAVPLEDSGIVSPPGEPPTPPGDSGIVSPPGEEPPTPPGEEIAPPSGFTENNAAPPSGFRIESNSTGNVTQSANIAETILAVHNQERALVGVPPLTWSDKLAADAKNWAEEMKATAGFSHSPSFLAGKLEYGEAIAGIFNETTAGIIQGQHDWSKEKDKLCADTGVCSPGYHGEPFYPYGWPNPPPELGGAPGHYTQMVWRTTTEVGCATSPAGGLMPFAVLVCRYTPTGNIFGEPAY